MRYIHNFLNFYSDIFIEWIYYTFIALDGNLLLHGKSLQVISRNVYCRSWVNYFSWNIVLSKISGGTFTATIEND